MLSLHSWLRNGATGSAAFLICSALQAQGGSQAFWVHGAGKSCSDITQLDSALTSGSQQFFAGWTSKDFDDALAWSQACANYGWHIPGKPRLPLLQMQRERSLGVTNAAPSGASLATAANAAATPSPTAASNVAATDAAVPPGGAAPLPAQPATPAAPAALAAARAGADTNAVIPGDGTAAPGTAAPELTAPVAAAGPKVVEAASADAVVAPSSRAADAAGASPPGASQAMNAANAPAASASAAEVRVPAASPAAGATSASLTGTSASAPASMGPSVASPVAVPVTASAAEVLNNPGEVPANPGAPPTQNIVTPLPTPAAPTLQPLGAAPVTLTEVRANERAERAPGEAEEDSLLTDKFFKEHFHRESLWVSSKANLDVGGRIPTSAQMKNRITADKIVLYCARKANTGESGSNRPLLWDWRWCEGEEAAAYNRLVTGNEFPQAGRAALLGCANVESYVYLERCIQTVSESGAAGVPAAVNVR